MIKDVMEYKGYCGSVHYNDEDETFYGKLAFIQDLVSYEGESVKALKQAFQEAVEDYLELCTSQGKAPDTPFKGSFSVRTGKDLHRQVALYAVQHDTNINTVVKEALQRYISVEF
jgi:predicted HicB family RNase H-like nuclease